WLLVGALGLALTIPALSLAQVSKTPGRLKVSRDFKYKVRRVQPQAAYATGVVARPSKQTTSGPGTLATGFEAVDGFAPGYIGGQAGWTAFIASLAEGHIDTINPAGGTQHLRISQDPAVSLGTFTGAFSPDVGPLASGASTVSVDVAIGATGGADYIVAAQSPSEGFLTWQVRFSFLGTIRILDDDGFGGFADFDTGVAWSVGPYVNLTVCDDPAAGTTDYFYGGVLIHSQSVHVTGTRVEQIVLLSDNFQGSDSGDFDNLSLSSGLAAACSAGSTCGNNVKEPGEACDGTDDVACPGLCLGDCTCPAPVCGNGILESGEICDGAADAACPGLCLADCTCGAPPPPPNDDCANASTTVIDTTTATTDGPPHTGHPACDAFGFDQLSEDVWYTHFATCTGDLTVTMCEELGGGADFDTRLAVYNPGCPATAGSLIDCNDDDPVNPCGGLSGGFHSTVTVPVTNGQEVLIRVGGFSDSGTGVLNVTCSAPPVCGNNITEAGEDCDGTDDAACPGACVACACPCGDFATSAACSTSPHLLTGSTLGAGDSCAQRSSEDEIWEITITEAGQYNFNMATNAPGGDPCVWDSFIYLMDGCCSGTVVASDDDCPGIGCFGNSCMECVQLNPGTYYLVVEGFGSGDAGDYVVTVDCCTAAVCGNNVAETGEECDGTDDAACPGLCQADCTCGAAPPPPNDDCANSIEAFVGTTPIDTSAATTDGPAHTGHPSCDSFGFDQLSEDIWFHHFATCTGDLTVDMCEELGGSANFDTRIAVYNPGCPATAGSLIDCNDDDPNNPCGGAAGGFHSTVTVPVTTGQEVLIRVGGFADSGTGVLNITCGGGGPPNDDCANSSEIFVGTTAVDTSAATTDGPAHTGHPACDAFGFDQLSEDIWYHHFATCTGDLTATMCEELGGGANFDTRIAFYNPGCPATAGSLIDCNDDDPSNPCGGGAGGFHSTLTISVTSGQEVLLRIGGFADSGTGTVNLTCTASGPVCGNNTTEAGEQCDGTDDAACPGLCQADCTCGTPPPICGDNLVNQASEACDGTDDAACPGLCLADCSCGSPPPVCGDNAVNQASEVCDGTDDAACPGQCRADCSCPPAPVCGDGVVNQTSELCDGTDDAACPGQCQADCTCPSSGVIPTVSEWGLIALALLLLAGAKVYFGRRRSARTA
ncbi:MAG: IPTL-CTERM sorting domain-containing protein, partial [Phycisphaerae bacterium]